MLGKPVFKTYSHLMSRIPNSLMSHTRKQYHISRRRLPDGLKKLPNLQSVKNYTEKIADDRMCNSAKTSFCIDKPTNWPSGKKVKFKFHDEIESLMNEHINVEFKAFYYYLSMASYFGRVDVALPGCESFFTQMHHEELEHALRFVNYIKMRGGDVKLISVLPPENQVWECPLNAFQTALQLEMEVSEKLNAVNNIAEKHNDLNASDFIVTGFMEDQMKSINEMSKFVTILSGIGDQSLARFMFDKDLLDNYVTPQFNVLKAKTSPKINN